MDFLIFIGQIFYALIAIGFLVLSFISFRIFFQLLPGSDGMNHLEREEMFGRYFPEE